MKRYLARQSIMDTNKKIYGYELLYRNSGENFFPQDISASVATQKLISSIKMDFDPDLISGGCLSFVNFPKEVIMSELILCLEADRFVIEILEDIIVDHAFAERIKYLQSIGYTFAIDDYTGEQDISEIVEYITIIKVDCILASIQVQKEIIATFGGTKRLLAEKIETEDEYFTAIQMGYHLFQGYFFSRPILIEQESIDVLNMSIIDLLKEAAKPELDYNAISKIINADIGITYRLFTCINTMKYATQNRVTSVQQALVHMGIIEAKRWLTLVCMQNIATKSQEETIKIALMRGFFAENVARDINADNKNIGFYTYLAGMFSIFSKEKQKKIYEILNCDINSATQEIMDEVVDFTFHYENAEWAFVESFATKYNTNTEKLYEHYRQAILHTEELISVK